MGSNPIHHPSPAKKTKSLLLDYVQLLMIGQAGQWTQTPCSTPLQPEKWNAHFWIMFTSDDRLGWLMDLNPIHHPSPARNMKCSFLDYVQLLMLARLVDGLEPHPPPFSSQKNERLILGLCSTSDDCLGWSMDSNPIHHASPAKKLKCSSLDYIQLLMLVGLVDGLKPHLPPLSSQKNGMLIFGLRSTSDDQLGWSMDLNPIRYPSPARKMKCSFLDYFQLLIISLADRWT